MSTITFRIAAKTDVGLVRSNNEDNFQASSDLSGEQMRWVNNESCSLGNKGALIVVADGMGGMNAGEVASELAIETIREYFSPERLTPDVVKNRFSIEKYMNDSIIAADARIKAEAKNRPEAKGMGTTIVIGWILDGKLYVSWCGDSRAYVYNPSAGLHQITKDHSYVQGLVDKGSLTREEAFDFPDSNIITRCLSDSSTKATPESLLRPYDICDKDIIMLCTDGLSGMIRDADIESIIRSNEHNVETLVNKLIDAACEAEGSDNITICICQILRCGNKCNPAVFLEYDKRLNGNKESFIRTLMNTPEDITPKNRLLGYIGLSCIFLAVISCAVWLLFFKKPGDPINPKVEETTFVSRDTTATSPDEPKEEMPVGIPQSTGNDKGKKPQTRSPERPEGEIPGSGSIFDEGEDPVLTPIPEKVKPNLENTQDNGGGNGSSEMETEAYTVQHKDTYYSLAGKFNTTVAKLQQLNNHVPLKAGTEIKVPKQQ